MFLRWLVLIWFACTHSAMDLLTCDSDGPGYAKFTSKVVAQILPNSPVTISGKCFEEITATMSQDETELVVEIVAVKHKGAFCVEFLIVTTGNTSRHTLLFLSAKESIRLPVSEMTEAEHKYAVSRGLKLLRSCDNLLNLPQNIFMTLKLFAGGFGQNPLIPVFGSKIPDYQLHANIDWVYRTTGYQWQLRSDPKTVKINKKNIRSGDYFAITRFDGLDNLIHVTTGSRTGHCTLAMWRDGELWVIESQDAWYWPHKGIQKNKFDDWIQWAENADYNVVLIQLSDEARAKFDVDKAWAEFDRLQGLSYGFSNFLFGYIDTLHDNLPDWIDLVFGTIIIRAVEFVYPTGIDRVFADGLNMRLGTKNLSLNGVWEEIYRRNLTIEELWAEIEQEGWKYPTSGENYVCSAFVIKMYKAGGLFGNLTINSPEFTPKDLYELNFFDVSGKLVPEECKEYAPRGYCQITGRIDLDLGRISWVEPYDHMAESCPTKAPEFSRRDKC